MSFRIDNVLIRTSTRASSSFLSYIYLEYEKKWLEIYLKETMLFMRGRCLRGFHQLIYQSNGIHSSNILRSFSTSQNVIAAAAGSVDKSIIHPLGNEKFTKYITEIRDEYSRIENQYTDIDQQTAKRHQLLKQILDICDERKSIVDAFLALNEELANEKDKEMLALGEEEKSVSEQIEISSCSFGMTPLLLFFRIIKRIWPSMMRN